MRILITGGTGLIGRALSASLAADGDEVVVLSRAPERAEGLPAGVRAVRWDGRTAAGWEEFADGADAIVNLAGANLSGGLWTEKRKALLRASRLNAGRAVVAAVQGATRRPRVVVQASGIGYYGSHGDEDIEESAPPGHDWLAGLAVEWENSTQAVDALGVRRAIIRSGGVLSREALLWRLMVLPHRFFLGGPLGGGRQWLPWIHIADEVGAIRFLIREEGAHGAFNLVAPDTVTNAEFERLLGKVMGRPAWFRVPAWLLRLVLGELSGIILEGQRAIPRRLIDLGYAFQFRNLEEALRDLL
jgi:uncharacterized protein (TIGR01777 family)